MYFTVRMCGCILSMCDIPLNHRALGNSRTLIYLGDLNVLWNGFRASQGCITVDSAVIVDLWTRPRDIRILMTYLQQTRVLQHSIHSLFPQQGKSILR